ncbi:MAG: hypothetical protein LBU36_02590 [Clostridiales bacterium]|jgi:hypothetical protein|nr:hypothetical protein [Clostridiales bacterium]
MMSACTIYYAINGKDPENLQDLVDADLLLDLPVCPEGGEYTLGDNGWTVVCSVHGQFDKFGGDFVDPAVSPGAVASPEAHEIN